MGLPLVLASASPRRRELLRQMGLEFEVSPSGADESIPAGLLPEAAAQEIAVRKCLEVSSRRPEAIIIAADTVVVLGSEILGKPSSPDGAAEMLRLLSGRTHQVITGLAVSSVAVSRQASCSVVTDVRFKAITEPDIHLYVATGEPMDKAGAYAIQGRAAVFVDSIVGCYSNVVGLPISRLAGILEDFGTPVPLSWN